MVAAQALAVQSKTIAVIGAGLQGIAHARAAIEVFFPESLILIGRSISAEAQELESEFLRVRISQNLDEAIESADIIFVCTNTINPVITKPLKQGTTLISIGSFSPNREEIAGSVVAQADLLFGDDSQTIQSQSGSIISAIKVNPSLEKEIISLGSLINNPALGRTSPEQIIMYFSVGLGIQDAAIVEKYLELEKL
jgi:ornithine cyclodeaminase/alanine dehydrogenase-like protein (mu-crystallin family)